MDGNVPFKARPCEQGQSRPLQRQTATQACLLAASQRAPDSFICLLCYPGDDTEPGLEDEEPVCSSDDEGSDGDERSADGEEQQDEAEEEEEEEGEADEEEGEAGGGGAASTGWAEAMAKILAKKTPASKSAILLKNKELEKVKEKEKEEQLERKKQVITTVTQPSCCLHPLHPF